MILRYISFSSFPVTEFSCFLHHYWHHCWYDYSYETERHAVNLYLSLFLRRTFLASSDIILSSFSRKDLLPKYKRSKDLSHGNLPEKRRQRRDAREEMPEKRCQRRNAKEESLSDDIPLTVSCISCRALFTARLLSCCCWFAAFFVFKSFKKTCLILHPRLKWWSWTTLTRRDLNETKKIVHPFSLWQQ